VQVAACCARTTHLAPMHPPRATTVYEFRALMNGMYIVLLL